MSAIIIGVKICTKCNKSKPLSDYFTDNSKIDGLYSSCRDCHAILKTKYRLDHVLKESKRSTDYNKRHPEKARMRWIVRNAIKSGKIRRPKSCEYCDKKNKLEAHHYLGYDVKFLCIRCHRNQHMKRSLSLAL